MYENDKLNGQVYALLARWCDLLEPFEDRTDEAEPLTGNQQSIYRKLKRYYIRVELRYYRRSGRGTSPYSVVTMMANHA
jgi:hypothetical protein